MGAKIKKVPAAGAAPFPPLNFSQIGKTCPIMQMKAEINPISGESNSPEYVAKDPFNMSDNNVKKANFFPVSLKTLVVPVP